MKRFENYAISTRNPITDITHRPTLRQHRTVHRRRCTGEYWSFGIENTTIVSRPQTSATTDPQKITIRYSRSLFGLLFTSALHHCDAKDQLSWNTRGGTDYYCSLPTFLMTVPRRGYAQPDQELMKATP